ncbi:MAG: hypothetical protein D6820_14470 [Lentisphaerae bacterium]|nr:MAG: hypothetical protein D6820_14470 [Lentisphaerota bacterium]
MALTSSNIRVTTVYLIREPERVTRQLALEESILDDLLPGQTVLFLWRSLPAVVLGKNQNPWRECRCSQLSCLGATLARRMSGGGTVWHDPGNWNYSWIGWRQHYDREMVLRTVCRALQRLGIPADTDPRHAITVKGKKISGSAFAFRHQKVLHHGTLLMRADLERMRLALEPDLHFDEVRGIASVPSPVMNLADMFPWLSDDGLLQALMAEFACGSIDIQPPPDSPKLLRLELQHHSWEWLFGRTPSFACRLSFHGRDVTEAMVKSGRLLFDTASSLPYPQMLYHGLPFDEVVRHHDYLLQSHRSHLGEA